MFLKRVKAHAERREPSTLLLEQTEYFADFQITRIKADASQYVCYVICYVTICSFVLSFTLFYLLPLDPFLMDSCVFSTNYYAHYVCKYTNYSAYYQILWKKLVDISFVDYIISTFLLLYGDKTAPEFHLTFGFFGYFA